MANIGQIYYKVLDTTSGEHISTSGVDIFSDIVKPFGASRFNKLGIQAPPGTKVILNSTKTIMVGRTGIYELDDDISVTSLYFDRPRKYTRDVDAEQTLIAKGMKGFNEAEEYRIAAMKDLPVKPEDTTSEAYQKYWDAYNIIEANYNEKYQAALQNYNKGVQGIYILPNQDNVNADENYSDLYNIIIDFIYE